MYGEGSIVGLRTNDGLSGSDQFKFHKYSQDHSDTEPDHYGIEIEQPYTLMVCGKDPFENPLSSERRGAGPAVWDTTENLPGSQEDLLQSLR